jgi:hypothetical protein
MKTSIHIIPCKVGSSEQHNRRGKELDYVAKDRQHLNEHWSCADGLPQYLIALQQEVKDKTGRAMQAKATPIREGVAVIRPDTTMTDLRTFAERLEAGYGVKTLQVHIHRDEGHVEDGEFKCNNHAHMVFDWVDHKTGRSLKLNTQDMSEIQTMLADTLGMERGIKSDKKHLSAEQYKTVMAERERVAAERDAALSAAKASVARGNLNAMEAPLAEVIETTENRLIEPLTQSRWDAVRLLFNPQQYTAKIRAKLAIIEDNFKKTIRERQRAEVELRVEKIGKSEAAGRLRLTPGQIEALANKQVVVLKNITVTNKDKTKEDKDIDLYWNDERKSVAFRENEEWRQNKIYQERMRLLREQQERLSPKKGQEPPLGEQRRDRGMGMHR